MLLDLVSCKIKVKRDFYSLPCIIYIRYANIYKQWARLSSIWATVGYHKQLRAVPLLTSVPLNCSPTATDVNTTLSDSLHPLPWLSIPVSKTPSSFRALKSVTPRIPFQPLTQSHSTLFFRALTSVPFQPPSQSRSASFSRAIKSGTTTTGKSLVTPRISFQPHRQSHSTAFLSRDQNT